MVNRIIRGSSPVWPAVQNCVKESVPITYVHVPPFLLSFEFEFFDILLFIFGAFLGLFFDNHVRVTKRAAGYPRLAEAETEAEMPPEFAVECAAPKSN